VVSFLLATLEKINISFPAGIETLVTTSELTEKNIVASVFPANHLRNTIPQADRKHSPTESFTTLDR
jgi:hypothetical protein